MITVIASKSSVVDKVSKSVVLEVLEHLKLAHESHHLNVVVKESSLKLDSSEKDALDGKRINKGEPQVVNLDLMALAHLSKAVEEEALGDVLPGKEESGNSLSLSDNLVLNVIPDEGLSHEGGLNVSGHDLVSSIWGSDEGDAGNPQRKRVTREDNVRDVAVVLLDGGLAIVLQRYEKLV